MRKICSMLLVSLFLSPCAMAKSKEGKKKYITRYGMAGCGVGSLLVTDKSRNAQIGVWAINSLASLVYINPTFAMTSGTSNCSDRPDGESGDDEASLYREEQEVYISVNLNDLKKDAVRGEGQFLDGLAQVFGCESDAANNALKTLSRKNFEGIFASSEPSVIRQNYLQRIQAQSASGEDLCQRLI